MGRKLGLVAAAVLAWTFAASGAEHPAVAAPAAPHHDFLAPAVDHHQHLLSRELAKLWSAKLRHATPSRAIAELLSGLERNWNNEAALAALYEDDAVLVEPRSEDLIEGRAAIAARLSHFFAAAFKLAPASIHAEGSISYAVIYLERPRAGEDVPFAEALMTFHRGADRKWRVAAETLKIPGPVVLAPFEAKDLVVLLDQAGIGRAVVLSGAYAFSDKSLPPDPDEYAHVRAENDWTAQQVPRFPGRLIAFCGVSPIKDYALPEIRRCATELHAAGVKLHFSNSGVRLTDPEHLKRVKTLFREANRLRLAIVAHLQTESDYGEREAKIFLNEVLPEAPDVVVQIAHMAGSGPGWNDEAFGIYADAVANGDPRTAKLYFDVATVAEGQSPGRLDLLAKRIRQVGVGRILYGSDASFGTRPTPRQEWAMFQGYVPLTPSEISAIADNVAPYLR